MLVVGEVMTSLSPAFAAASPDLATLSRTTRLALDDLQVSLSVQCSDCRPPFKPHNSLYHRHYNVFHKSIEIPRDVSLDGVKYLENMRGDLHVCGAYYLCVGVLKCELRSCVWCLIWVSVSGTWSMYIVLMAPASGTTSVYMVLMGIYFRR